MGPGLSQDRFPHTFGGNPNYPDSNGIVGASEHGKEETIAPADSPDNNGGYPKPWQCFGRGRKPSDPEEVRNSGKSLFQKLGLDADPDIEKAVTDRMETERRERATRAQEEIAYEKRQKDNAKAYRKAKQRRGLK